MDEERRRASIPDQARVVIIGGGLITSAGMATETLLWMSRYTRDLCETLEAETGQATGFRAIGHLHLATTPQRLETLRREAAFVRGLGVDNRPRVRGGVGQARRLRGPRGAAAADV